MVSSNEAIAGHTVGAVLGRGGWAVVYRAQDADGRTVALKVLNAEHRRPDQQARLHREFEFAGLLEHPGIIEVYQSGPVWLSMELINGGTVSRLPTPGDRINALVQIAGALDHAHRRGIIHCDVKPGNILVKNQFSDSGPRHSAVLIDFGVAHSMAQDVAARLSHNPAHQLTLDPARRIAHGVRERSADVQASLQYAAPELLSDRALSAATDQYALACTAVELLTGSAPFTADTAMGLVDQHLNSPPPRISKSTPWVPPAVDSVLCRAMAKRPDGRYDSCVEFMTALDGALR